MKRIFFLFLFLVSIIPLFGQQFDTITDSRDGQKYDIVLIGNQWWMAENLNYFTPSGSWYYDDDSVSYADTLGRLYNWQTAQNVCPSGWILPSDDEWKELEIFLGMDPAEADQTGGRGTDEGSKLKYGGETGFNALFAGQRDPSGDFSLLDLGAYFWTSTEETPGASAFNRDISSLLSTINRSFYFEVRGYSVRCLKVIDSLNIQLTGFDVSTIGGNDGSIDLAVIGGLPPYSYSWSNSATTEDISGLTAGVYSVTVSDARDSTFTDSIRIYDTFLDERDGQVYKAVTIGDQIWMAENLKTTKYNDGTDIPLVTDSTAWVNLTTPAYCWYNNDQATYKATYGALYNWYVVNTGQLCPTGWHVPNDAEGTTLTTYLGGEAVAGGMLKEAGITHWLSPNTGATNESGFTALPGGGRANDGIFLFNGEAGYWWFSTEYSTTNAYKRYLTLDTSYVYRSDSKKEVGFSVRCVKNIDTLKITLIESNVSSLNGTDGSIDLTVSGGLQPYSYSWSTGDTEEDLNGLSAGVYTVTVTDALDSSVVDSIRIYDTFLDERDGQVYKAVTLGDQVWMAENLKAIDYSDGTAIPLVEDSTAWANLPDTDKAYCYYNNNSSIGGTYGALYTWATAMNGAASSDANPSGIQGVCPGGWHLPSDAEWKELEMFLGMSQAEADGNYWRGTDEGNKIREADTTHWLSPNTGATNSSGFTALPGGSRHPYQGFRNMGGYASFWSSTELDFYAYARKLYYDYSEVWRYFQNYKEGGFSVRCVKNQCSITNIQLNKTDVSCSGDLSGIVDLTVSGIGKINYQWSTGDTIEDLINLSAGWYKVTVTDTLNCSLTDSIEILEPPLLIARITDSTNISSAGLSDGSATISPSGGAPPYTYLWDDDLITTDSTVNGLSANKWYHVVISDGNGCIAKDSVILSEPGTLYAEITNSENVSCYGLNDGSAKISIWGGTQPYSIIWDDDAGSTTATVTDLAANRWYHVIITDNSMLTAEDSSFIAQPDSLQVLKDYSEIACSDNDTGYINLTINGGIPPYTFNWSSGDTREDLDSLSAGEYSVIVTDMNGCEIHDTTVIVMDSTILNMWHMPVVVDPSVNYSIGNMPATVDFWYWDFGDGDTTSANSSGTHTYTSNGIFDLCLIGINACETESACIAFAILSSGTQEWVLDSHINLYPNPTTGKIHLEIDNPEFQEIEIHLINSTGSVLKIMKVNAEDVTLDMSYLPKGIYSMRIINDEAIITRKVIHQ